MSRPFSLGAIACVGLSASSALAAGPSSSVLAFFDVDQGTPIQIPESAIPGSDGFEPTGLGATPGDAGVIADVLGQGGNGGFAPRGGGPQGVTPTTEGVINVSDLGTLSPTDPSIISVTPVAIGPDSFVIVPLPAAVWGGLAVLGGLAGYRRMIRRA